jgi:N-acetylated-alpha-linked acidic dipeptidase
MKGPMAPARWRGALDITYHVGPGPAKVRLKVESNWDIKRLYNVVAKIPGSVAPSEWIVRGNHHDAWVNGADDPVSAQAALLEEARALGELLKQGWKPRRTIICCAWDGEEPMLLGSTEWAEMHANELARHAAVYVNTDANSRGLIEMEGSHSLEAFINDVARDIQDPETGLSVWKRRQLSDIVRASSANDRSILRTRRDLRIRPLGSGSDYTAFLDHLGIASLNLSYGGEDPAGIYHSIYDDFYWYTHFSDIDFVYGRVLAQTIGVTVMRLADAEVLPFDFTNLADTVKMYNRELQELLRDRQEESRERNQELDEGAFRAVSDPRRPAVDPVREEVPPFINFAPLQNSVDTLAQSAERYQKSIAKAQDKLSEPGSAALIQAVNEKLIQLERRLTSPEGLPRRPWYKHLLYAPGVYTGYSPKTVPGVREGIELKRYSEAEKEIVRVAQALADAAAAIDAVSQLLGKIGN